MVVDVTKDADRFAGGFVFLEVEGETILLIHPAFPDSGASLNLFDTQGWVRQVCLKEQKGFDGFLPDGFG